MPDPLARALGRLGDPTAIPPLIDAASTHQGEARVAVFEALAALKAREAVPAARRALSDPYQRVRRWAAFLLREVDAQEALPELRQALGDEDPGVRLQAVQATERLNDLESVEKIREALPKETLKEVREAMEKALETLTATHQSSPRPSGPQNMNLLEFIGARGRRENMLDNFSTWRRIPLRTAMAHRSCSSIRFSLRYCQSIQRDLPDYVGRTGIDRRL